MKKIKPVVLKDATKLTNSEMKKIRGGWYENSSSTVCSATCESGASKSYVIMDCSYVSDKSTCAISRDENDTAAICINEAGIPVGGSAYTDSCGNPPLPPTRII